KGTQIVAVAGTVTDGTSRAYTDLAEVPADSELWSLLGSVADGLSLALVPVKIATVDAVYRETDDDIRRWRDGGAVAINMGAGPVRRSRSPSVRFLRPARRFRRSDSAPGAPSTSVARQQLASRSRTFCADSSSSGDG